MALSVSTEQGPRSVGKTFSGAAISFGPGAIVSLNLERRSFLATADRKFFMNEVKPTGKVPYDLGDGALSMLKTALDTGDIVLGDQPVPRAFRTGLMEPVFQEIDQAESPDHVKRTLTAIAMGQKRMDGHPPAEIVRRLAIHEAETQCRQDFLDLLASYLEHIPGPSGVEEYPQDRTEVHVNPERKIADGMEIRTPEQIKAVRDLI